MAVQTPKARVAELIETWVRRSGLQKQQAAVRAGLGDYNEFYRAYLDKSRALNTDPTDAIGVVRAFSERLTAAERCTADEAVRFFILTQLPLTGYEQVWRLGLFPADEWRTAIAAHLSFEPPAPAPDMRAVLELAERLLAAPAPADTLAAAARLAAMPVGSGAPLPDIAPLPRHHRMPFSRNPLFQGRADDLRRLAGLLAERPAAAGQAVAIVGLGGLGKTSLAVEFVHRYAQFFAGGVFWLSCADARQLPVEAAACGAALFDDAAGASLAIDEQVRRFRAAMAEPTPRLLVLDNCEDDATLDDWRPVTGGCRVLLTSRRIHWPARKGVATLELGELPRAAGVGLLRSYRPDLAPDTPALAELCALLGDLPLALHLAGSYLESFGGDAALGDPRSLLAALRAADPLAHEALGEGEAGPPAAANTTSVGQTFAVSFDRLDASVPSDASARAMLGRAGWLAPNTPFDRALVAGAEGGDARVAALAARRLRDLGLLGDQDGALRIHPLVAAFARRVGGPAARAEAEAALLAAATQIYREHDITALRRLLPHLLLRSDELGARDDDDAVLFCNLAALLMELGLGDAAGSLPYVERARLMLEGRGALATALGATVLNNLGTWHQVLGDLDGARRWLIASLEIRERLLAPDDPDLAQGHNNLAELLRESGDLATAEGHFARALAILDGRGEGTSGLALAARNNLALLVRDQGRYAEAARQFGALLVIVEAALGGDDPRATRTRHNLGDAMRRAGDLAGARPHLVAAAETAAAQLGDDHPDTLLMRHTLALLTADEGDLAAGLASLAALGALATAHLGADHPVARRIGAALRELEQKTAEGR